MLAIILGIQASLNAVNLVIWGIYIKHQNASNIKINQAPRRKTSD
jgi:hypothetical protein